MATVDVQLTCETCQVEIRLTIVRPQERASDRYLRVAINELLVDHGWLPARPGPYCREHAAQLRR